MQTNKTLITINPTPQHSRIKKVTEKPEHYLFLTWLILFGLIVFGVIVAWREGLLLQLVTTDQSKLSLVIALLYLVTTIHCARRIVLISRQLAVTDRAEKTLAAHPDMAVRRCGTEIRLGDNHILPEGYVTRYLRDLFNPTTANRQGHDDGAVNGTLAEVFAASVKGPNAFGWFVVDILIKLGLLGTIVGFILMLEPVSNISTLDVSAVQKVLKEMSSGMGTALYTTLAGLTGSVLLAAQYELLDRGTDELIEKTVYLAEVQARRRFADGIANPHPASAV